MQRDLQLGHAVHWVARRAPPCPVLMWKCGARRAYSVIAGIVEWFVVIENKRERGDKEERPRKVVRGALGPMP